MARLLPRLRHRGRKIPVLRDDAELLDSWTWLPPCFIRLTFALSGAPLHGASALKRVVRRAHDEAICRIWFPHPLSRWNQILPVRTLSPDRSTQIQTCD